MSSPLFMLIDVRNNKPRALALKSAKELEKP